jgi:hypothetical protein
MKKRSVSKPKPDDDSVISIDGKLSDLTDALNQASQALTVQLTPDVAAALQRIDDWNRLAPNSLGERLAPDVVAFFERIDLAGLAPPQDLRAESLPLAQRPGQRRGGPQGPQEHRRVVPEQSKCKTMESELDSILESAGAAKFGRLPEERTRLARQFACAPEGLGLTEAQFEDITFPEFIAAARRWQHSRVHPGRPQGQTEDTKKIAAAWIEMGRPKPTDKVCDDIAKAVGIKPKGWTYKRIRNKIRSAIYRFVSASSSGA